MLDRLLRLSPVLFLLAPCAGAQCPDAASLFTPAPAPGDDVGCAVALDGARALVGARNQLAAGFSGAGAAHVFERQAGAWIHAAELVPDDAGAGARFGSAVALEGDRAVIGAYTDDHGGVPDVGSAYVFERQAGGWVQVAKLIASDASSGAAFGTRVALSGDRLLVGAPTADLGADSWVGGVYVFERQGGAWVEVAKLLSSTASELDLFGYALDLDGDRAAVGAYGEDQGALLGVGAVYVFERQGGAWVETAALFAPAPAPYERFGFSVALDGERLLAAAPRRASGGAPSAGGGFVFELFGGSWVQTALLEAPAPAANVELGWSLDLDGALAVLSSPAASVGGLNAAGTARAFLNRGPAGWLDLGPLALPAPVAGDRLGWSTSLDAGVVALGVIAADAPGVANAGGALVVGVPPCATSFCACDAGAPCANPDPLAGCANSTGSGALLSVLSGSASVSANDLVLGGSNLLPSQPGLFFQGDDALNGGAGIAFGDGLRCVGNSVIRLQVVTPGAGGTAQTTVAIATLGGVSPGVPKRYQLWYRDPLGSPCGSGFNLSDALEILWVP